MPDPTKWLNAARSTGTTSRTLVCRWLISPWGVTLGEFLTFWIPLALLGAGSSAGSLALARRAEDRELLEDGADVSDVGLTEEDTRELLGKT